MIRFLTNEEPVQVSAELVRRRTVRVEDIAFANYALPSGLRCCVEVSRVSGGRMCRVEAIGTAGAWVADVTQSVLWRIVGRTADAERVPDRPTLVTVLEEFARSLQSGAAMPVTGEDGLRAVAMAEPPRLPHRLLGMMREHLDAALRHLAGLDARDRESRRCAAALGRDRALKICQWAHAKTGGA